MNKQNYLLRVKAEECVKDKITGVYSFKIRKENAHKKQKKIKVPKPNKEKKGKTTEETQETNQSIE